MEQARGRKKRKVPNIANTVEDGSSMLADAPKQRLKRSKASTRPTSEALEDICESCATIDLDAGLAKKVPTRRGQLVKKLKWNPMANFISCSLCRWLATVKSGAYYSNELRAFSSTKSPMGWQSVDITMLGLDPRGPFLPHSSQPDRAETRKSEIENGSSYLKRLRERWPSYSDIEENNLTEESRHTWHSVVMVNGCCKWV